MTGLTALESFEAYRFGLGSRGKQLSEEEFSVLLNTKVTQARRDIRYCINNPPIPWTFSNLKYLKISQDEKLLISNISNRHDGFLTMAKKLEYLGLPLGVYWDSPEMPHMSTLSLALACIADYVGRGGVPCLKTVDFASYNNFKKKEMAEMELLAGGAFAHLLMLALKHKIKLKNVVASWFWGERKYPPEMGHPITSLINLPFLLLKLDMPNLERITVRATSQCSLSPAWMSNRPNWPALQVLEINVDSGAKLQLRFLFDGVRRLRMKELRLNFMTVKDQVATPKVEDIVTSCPNLKKLTLVNWPGTNKALINFWNGLPGLEDVTLDNCKELGNVAFVGTDVENPVFFKLKCLRKLTLKGLDMMPKITDLLFSLVLPHLKLTHLVITSEQPIEKVSVAGIYTLLQRKFAESIIHSIHLNPFAEVPLPRLVLEELFIP